MIEFYLIRVLSLGAASLRLFIFCIMAKLKTGIIRVVKDRDNPFVQIKKTLAQNKDLSWKARGIATYILSLPDDWDLNIEELTRHATDGRDSTTSGVTELINYGHMTRERVHKKNGHFAGYDYTFYESAQTVDIPTINGKPVNGSSVDGKPPTTNTELTNTSLLETAKQKVKAYVSTYPDTIKSLRMATHHDLEGNSFWELVDEFLRHNMHNIILMQDPTRYINGGKPSLYMWINNDKRFNGPKQKSHKPMIPSEETPGTDYVSGRLDISKLS